MTTLEGRGLGQSPWPLVFCPLGGLGPPPFLGKVEEGFGDNTPQVVGGIAAKSCSADLILGRERFLAGRKKRKVSPFEEEPTDKRLGAATLLGLVEKRERFHLSELEIFAPSRKISSEEVQFYYYYPVSTARDFCPKQKNL
jgi:hypothetical protein